MFESSDFSLNQNHLGKYVSLSVWAVSITFCFYYLAMDADFKKLMALGVISLAGIGTSALYTLKRNREAVIIQCLLMYASLMILLSMPFISKYAILTVLIVALNPVIFLNKMKVELVFGNLIVSLMVLIIFQLTKPISSAPILEQLLDFFMKFIMIVFVFVQVYGMRLMYERSQPRDND
ncbi:hypothetical protein ACLSU7_01460 [Bdellovibrio sp. HCB185ZH]|uniref:hypothetical protein n=1 Tax=Bdellovibrio sp. HCB185ZH TaxID=3394235 RepID=UPI0039A4887D